MKEKLRTSIRSITSLLLAVSLVLSQTIIPYSTLIFPPSVYALNDTTKDWNFNAGTSGDYTYDTDLVAVDGDGAHPTGGTTGANHFSNPDFATDTTGWSTAAVAPSGYVEVPNDATYDTGNFLVAQYEAKYDCTGDGIGDTSSNMQRAC